MIPMRCHDHVLRVSRGRLFKPDAFSALLGGGAIVLLFYIAAIVAAVIFGVQP